MGELIWGGTDSRGGGANQLFFGAGFCKTLCDGVKEGCWFFILKWLPPNPKNEIPQALHK
jgi:hypothetical protein